MAKLDVLAQKESEFSSMLEELMPSLSSAYACLDCESIRRTLRHDRCAVCGSNSTINLARILSERTN